MKVNAVASQMLCHIEYHGFNQHFIVITIKESLASPTYFAERGKSHCFSSPQMRNMSSEKIHS